MSKIKNGKAAGTSGFVSEMARSVVEAGVDMITNLIQQTIVELLEQSEKLHLCQLPLDKGRCFRKRGNYGRLKWNDQILKIVPRVSEILIGQKFGLNEM